MFFLLFFPVNLTDLWQLFSSPFGSSLDQLENSFFDLMVGPLALVLLPLVDEGVIAVLDHMLGPAPLEGLHDVRPFGPLCLHHRDENVVLLARPFLAVYLRVDVVGPSLPALGICPEVPALAEGIKIKGHFLPLGSFLGSG